jgi:hypothetical protein
MRPEQLAKATDCAVESILRIMDIYGLEIDESLSYLHILTAAMFRTHDSLTAQEFVAMDPAHTLCSCRKSVILPPHPTIHCVKCHRTYIARGLTYPYYCPRPCGFNFKKWRDRNGIPEIVPALTPPKENTDGTQNPPSC